MLSKVAKLEKVSQDVDAPHCSIGASCMQGWRYSMEDAHTIVGDVDGRGSAFVGVYDSHITARAAQFCAQNMHKVILEQAGDEQLESPSELLRSAFVEIDKQFAGTIADPSDPDSVYRAGGCTATVVLLTGAGTRLTVAGVGDCRCVASRGGVAEELTRDHKPELPDELERIQAVGGKLLFGRLRDLNVSRGIGDYRLKIPADAPPEEQQLSAVPEVRVADVGGDSKQAAMEFVVVASDGIWECRKSQEVVEFVRARIGSKTLSGICEELIDSCVKAKNPRDKDEPGTSDNITVAILVPKCLLFRSFVGTSSQSGRINSRWRAMGFYLPIHI